ncbi:Zn(II)2Cys6 transcription factor [Phanerochaete sordida]|uniref:Zn(II)2Cys6 transcription factor n=1 Tax=Phanerochaete sordida TaxID=48140 RepID=A0A9P3GBJ3_9APHY|nr:Zn(II)2Cys6 transcription factor [Phanerochaete sordida]
MSDSESSRPNQLPRGKACLRCRRRKMRCNGERPSCRQCGQAGILDCEYTDNGPTISQVLEENVAELEARIQALQGDSGPILLHDPHQPRPRTLSSPTGRQDTLQKIMQTFIAVSPTFGFFFDPPRFLPRLRASMPPSEHTPVSVLLVRTIELVGAHFSADAALRHGEEQRLAAVLQAIPANLDRHRLMDTLQAEVLLAHYLLHCNRRTEGSYHAAAAVSIAVACELHKLPWADGGGGAGAGAPGSPVDDADGGTRLRAFWTVFALERAWSAWMHSTPAWPVEVVNHGSDLISGLGQHGGLMIQDSVLESKAEMPLEVLLLLRLKAAILFAEASRVGERLSGMAVTSPEFTDLEGRINTSLHVVAALELRGRPPHYQLSLLLTRTLLSCAVIQLRGYINCHESGSGAIMVHAAMRAVEGLKSLDVPNLLCVDPVHGLLWANVGRILLEALTVLSGTPTAETVMMASGAPDEEDISGAVHLLFETMASLEQTSPLIKEELEKLRRSALQKRLRIAVY